MVISQNKLKLLGSVITLTSYTYHNGAPAVEILNSAITYQIQLEFSGKTVKANFSTQAKNFGH